MKEDFYQRFTYIPHDFVWRYKALEKEQIMAGKCQDGGGYS